MATLLASPLDVKDMWLTNLLLLGLDRHAHEYNIQFTRDMFSVPNQKGMEAVLHFLFSQLNSQRCYEELRDCWPIFDKKQEQTFRKKCCTWFAEIAKEDPACAISRSTGSLLLSPAGDRFYQLLEMFSTHCLRVVLVRETNTIEKAVFIPQSVREPCSVSSLPEVMDHCNKLHTTRHIQRFTQRLSHMTNLHEEWRQYSCSLIEGYRHSLKHTRELDESMVSLKQQRLAQHQQQTSGHTSPRKAASSDRRIKRVRQLWSRIDKFITDTASQREVVDSILQDGDSKLTINGADLNTKVPELVLSRLSEQDKPLTLVNEKGKVNLIELTKVWSAAIQLVTETLRANGLPDLSRDEEYIQEQLPVQLNSLTEIQTTRGALSLLRGKIEENIRQREAVLEPLRAAAAQDRHGESPIQQEDEKQPLITLPSLSVAPVEYQLLPPTPHKVTTPQSPPPTPYYMRPSLTKTVSTPDAVRSISQQIARASQQHHRPPLFSSIPVPSSAHPLTHSSTASVRHTHPATPHSNASSVRHAPLATPHSSTAAVRHVPLATPHNSAVTARHILPHSSAASVRHTHLATPQHSATPHKPSSHKKRERRAHSIRKKTHTARQTDQGPSSSCVGPVSSPGIPPARTVFSPSSDALADHIADIVSGVRTTPISSLPSHLSLYTTPQSPSEAFVSHDKIQRTPLSPAPSQRFSHISPRPGPSLTNSSQHQAASPVTTSQRTAPLSSTQPAVAVPSFTSPQRVSLTPQQQQQSPSSLRHTKAQASLTPSRSPRRAPLAEHNHADMFLTAASSSFQLVDSDSDDSILSADSPEPADPSSSPTPPPIGLLINFRDSPLH